MQPADIINLKKQAVFPVHEQGRAMFAKFVQENRVLTRTPGEFVNDNKREPCLWVEYLEGLDPYMTAKDTDDGEPTGNTKKRVKA